MDGNTGTGAVHLAVKALRFVHSFRASIAAIMLLTVLVSVLNAVEPLFMKMIFDSLGEGRTGLRAFVMAAGGLAVIGLAGQGICGLLNWLTWRVRILVNDDLREAIVGRLYSLPLSFFRNRSVGGIVTQINRGIDGCMEAFAEVTTKIFPNIMYLMIALCSMFFLNRPLFAVALVFAPLPTLIGALAAREQTEREEKLLSCWTRIFSRFNEALSGISIVKIFDREVDEKCHFMGEVRRTNRVVLRGVVRDSSFGSVIGFTIRLGRIATILFGCYLVIRGRTTVGTVIAFISYMGELFGPVQGLTGTYQNLRKSSVFLRSIFEILEAPDHLGDSPDALCCEEIRGDVSFEHVGFEYTESVAVLKNINVSISAGQCVALVGPSGAGKTTLMSLLQHLENPTSGRICLDGTDIRRIRNESLRRQIGCVPQETVLFNDTAANNIAYGKPGAGREEIESAAWAANAHDFITALPQGYDTVVGELGSRLSAGQRQRIAIARALLRQPRILILDEATSALDAECESLIQNALDKLIPGRTTFIIAHRLHTIVKADRILVMRDGEITAEGRHEELMSGCPYYASLVNKQTNDLAAPRLLAA